MMKFKHLFVFFIINAFLSACNENLPSAAKVSGESEIGKKALSSIKWMDSVIDLGKVKMGDTAVFRFRFSNTGNHPLIIEKTETSCSCTHILQTPSVIPPGGSGEIVAVYDTRKSIVGFIHKALLVATNTVPAKRQLLYSAEVTGHKLRTGGN